MKEYDVVKVIRDRDEYLKEGVHAGDIGEIIYDKTDKYCLVQFLYSEYESVETCIRTEDLEVVEPAPPLKEEDRIITICDKNGIRKIKY